MPTDTSEDFKNLILRVRTPICVFKTDQGIMWTASTIQDLTDSSRCCGSIRAHIPAMGPEDLGDRRFMERHGLAFPYIAGAMANGIASTAMVKTMAENKMIGFFGSGGLSPDQIEAAIVDLKSSLPDKPFGFNLIHSMGDPDLEMTTVRLYLKHGVRRISAAAFLRITPALVYYRLKGLHRRPDGSPSAPNHILAKVSRVEVARQFFSPPPEKIVQWLLDKRMITDQEAGLARLIPMARDLTAEADSGGHTDNRPAITLLPTLLALKNEHMARYAYHEPLCVGLAGGIATPESAAAAFQMGAAYILTGSVNQSCVEAGICEEVKKLLCQADPADTAMAPSADMFEIGARVQVLKRGTLFPVRAEKLYRLYQSHSRFEDIDEKTRQEVQEKILQARFEDAWASTRAFFLARGLSGEVDKAEADPHHKMALVFRSYLGLSSKWSIRGQAQRKMDYQIWCGPSMGAFNQWVKGSFMASPENRKTAEVALNLLFWACVCTRISFLRIQGIRPDPGPDFIKPIPGQEILSFLNEPATV